ncbi:hypothetical protein BTI_2179 [Burkholderia thailandensis MSMB121]|uniref:DUF3085 domain-containing protein n=1 Tax=Burkholderia humptydooensis TaxID=430531 RepID=UPI000327F4C8|nr:DUF3085 domain-containing protein [Burkholderia humptydooensis]AGK49264.1 hypothetical protein BTI_2179 [Burkholderia thailandensis MSMB121]ATF37190.1 DUF3085 domain-containing protein [Burkholderia thailandensis]KST74563.1 hypothetical protein WS76_10605 [Burkholderia humptydooensis]
MLRFTATDLRPVLLEARERQCSVLLVKDHGVYFMAEHGEANPAGHRRHIAYALECNPNKDAFDTWYDRAHDELGGDDFAEHFDANNPLFVRVINDGYDLTVRATSGHLLLEVVEPATDA